VTTTIQFPDDDAERLLDAIAARPDRGHALVRDSLTRKAGQLLTAKVDANGNPLPDGVDPTIDLTAGLINPTPPAAA
jgi:hypothetical protein